MRRSDDRILTTHTGALHRPSELEELMRRKLGGERYAQEEFDQLLRRGVAEVIRKQREIGIDMVDDGEYGKSMFTTYVIERMNGFEKRPPKPGQTTSATGGTDRQAFAQFYKDVLPPSGQQSGVGNLILLYMPPGTAAEPPFIAYCVGPVSYCGQALVRRDIDNLTAALDGVRVEDAFLPVISVMQLATATINEHYPNEEAYYYALADALKEEYRAIYDAGITVQIDDTTIAGKYKMLVPQGGEAAYRKWASMAVEAQNYALAGIPEDRIRYHLCWGSHNAPHSDDAPLSAVIDELLRIKAQAYQIEAANARHGHEWKVWKEVKLPDGKILMPGVISHATNVIEHPEYVAERIVRFAEVVGRENVIAATDCGFRWRTHPQIAWAKLQALVDGAKLATRELWNL